MFETSSASKFEVTAGSGGFEVLGIRVPGATQADMWAGTDAAFVPIPSTPSVVPVSGWELKRFDDANDPGRHTFIAVRGDRVFVFAPGSQDDVLSFLAGVDQ